MVAPIDTLTLHRYQCTNDSYTLDLGAGVLLTLMLIPAGEFFMGSADDDPEAESDERPRHPVELTQVLMAATPITQAQWRVVAGYEPVDRNVPLQADPAEFKGDDLPVESVIWHEATEFCQRLSHKTGKQFHLPSEAQWEYACRAETETAYHFGPQITPELANYNAEVGQTTPVGTYPANRWGLYDMHGNVWEWCQDDWHDSYNGAPKDGTAWVSSEKSEHKIIRGGAWNVYPRNCRSASRYNYNPGNRLNPLGFRVVCSAPRTLQ